MTELNQTISPSWPYSPESLVTYVFFCIRSSNYAAGIGSTLSDLLAESRSGCARWMFLLFESTRKFVLSYECVAFLVAYFVVLLALGTAREFSASWKRRQKLREATSLDGSRPDSPAGEEAAVERRRSISSSSTSLVAAATVRSGSRPPTETFDHFLGVFDLAKKSRVPGHVDQVLSLMKQFFFPLEWRCPSASMTLLHCALLGGDVRLVEHLIVAGSDVHARNTYGDTCLYLAVYTAAFQGFCDESNTTGTKITPVLTDADDDVNDRAMMEEDDAENLDPNRLSFYVLDLLIDRGADINAANYDGHAPLHYGASMGHTPLVTFLLERGARPEAKNREGFMPLQMALNNGHLETASLLQRFMGQRLREEAKLLKAERNKFWQKFAASSGIDRWPRKGGPGSFFQSDTTYARESSSRSSCSSFSIPRRNGFI